MKFTPISYGSSFWNRDGQQTLMPLKSTTWK